MRRRVNRRAFLRGAAGVAVALPFLESLPERSAWAEEHKPIFSLFICTANGIVADRFFPERLGRLSKDLLAAGGRATAALANHAERLLIVRNVEWPGRAAACSHIQALCMALTGRLPTAGERGELSMHASGPSADMVIANMVQPGTLPLTLYAGNRRNGYIAERLSFDESGMTRAAQDNPYTLYAKLVGITNPDGSTGTDAERLARQLLASRQSVHDLVREDLSDIMRHPRLGARDKRRLQQHFDALRDAEISMGGMGNEASLRCQSAGLDIPALEALSSGLAFSSDGMIEKIAELQMSLVAMAFACNQNRTATLQWGDGTDKTTYMVPSNTRAWPFHYISHRAQTDGMVGDDSQALVSHVEIDAVRMSTFAAGLDHFEARGLADDCFVLWTNQHADGPLHTFKDVPMLIWGNAGGFLKQGEHIDVGPTVNNRLLNTLISAAVRDTGQTVTDFGTGTPGMIDALLA